MITATSPRGLLLIWTAFLTGLFLAFCLINAARLVGERVQRLVPKGETKYVQKVYETRPAPAGSTASRAR